MAQYSDKLRFQLRLHYVEAKPGNGMPTLARVEGTSRFCIAGPTV